MEKALKKYFPVFVLPTAAAFVIGFIVPFIMAVYLSFCSFTTVSDATFVGIKNYIEHISSFGIVFRTVYHCYGHSDQCTGFYSGNVSDKKDKRHQYFQNYILYAKPDRRYCSGLCMAASVQRFAFLH